MNSVSRTQFSIALAGALFLAGWRFPAQEIVAGKESYSWSGKP